MTKNATSVENGLQKQEKNRNGGGGGSFKVKPSMESSDGGDGDGDGEGEGGTVALANSVKLPESVLQELYHSYSIKQRRGGLKWFLFASILFNIWSLLIPQGQPNDALVVTLVVLILNIKLIILMHLQRIFLRPEASVFLQRAFRIFLTYAPHLFWMITIMHFALYIMLQDTISPRDVLGWAILLNFLIYVTLPIPLFYTGCVLGFDTFIVYLGVITAVSRTDPRFVDQILTNAILTLTSILIGLLHYFLDEAKQKRAFLETKQSLEVKMVIEEQSAEQERLLLSVLPKHVAVKMRQDLGSTSSEPFKKIYMSRHENVSILYADIVGFTAISSTYSAQDLVKMLNELFARFDRLAEKYQQLRIKILGDCYYCISGAPDERPDHAVLCVFMGLSMVKAIKYVQQKTNSPVDMRVGIHTGAILAGILGQRQWQFDIYSKDVVLANKMESSGKAGFVHISDKTLSFLNGEFEVEPAYGERREEALRIAGLKTYFITKVLKPFASPCARKTIENRNNDNDPETLDDELLAETKNADNGKQSPGKGDNEAEVAEKQAIFQQRLKEELIARDGHENLSEHTNLLLKFNDNDLESAYATYREPYSSVPLLAALLVQLVDVIYSYIMLPRCVLHLVNISLPLLPISMLVIISAAESFPKYVPGLLVNASKRYNDFTLVRELTAIVIATTIGFTNIINMFFFVEYLKERNNEVEGHDYNLTTESYIISESIAGDLAPKTETMYPSFMSHYGILILIAIAVIAQLTHVTKILLMILITALHCYCNIFVLQDLYAFEDSLAFYPSISTSYCASGLILLAALALSFFARNMDREDRVIYKWKTEVAKQKETASDMRRRNEALVYNVLPVHVAEHFMKNTKRSHDDLYSQSYAEVGVLFASMPNFSDFYSEETVNNQGLECLRFLNEVISDFDALLELPQFQDIIKIKTIGSTYMAASGININHNSQPGDPITKRWAHLAQLVEFALELKNALQGINEQSFNHFVLKMGINHGPITAGVIGARKPHYDIWGNTVNVASRMESTGKAGAIQVTEETCNILEQFGYTFLQRGLVSVKGKGELMTYYLQGKTDKPNVSVNQELSQKTSNSSENPNKKLDASPAQDRKSATSDHNEDADIKTPLLNCRNNQNDSTIGSPHLDHEAIERDALVK